MNLKWTRHRIGEEEPNHQRWISQKYRAQILHQPKALDALSLAWWGAGNATNAHSSTLPFALNHFQQLLLQEASL